MNLANHVNTFGQAMLNRYGERVHKVSIDASFTCPNRDGSLGIGGCTFCNNVSFSPNSRQPAAIKQQIDAGKFITRKRTGARKYIAYFQAYTNTYAETELLKQQYNTALAEPDIIGIAVGTRPDCVADSVLDLLADYQNKGYEVWLELGLQSSFDETLDRVNRGHGFEAYRSTLKRARQRGLQVCTHLIIGLPGESEKHYETTLERVLELGVDGLKLHPLHVVKGTQLANEWRRGEYQPLGLHEYTRIAADLIQQTPPEVIYHRLTATASENILLAPGWCSKKWLPLNLIAEELEKRKHFYNAPILIDDATKFKQINVAG
ncbi:MAG: TIGR01212 family radical SAM protein [Gammaproteobacteria bacterium]|nr:TIGR01212 family radical SAM protein [Gammaproteobacteria bacterium]